MTENDYQKLISFFKNCEQYTILHEESHQNKKFEHYFIFITKNDIEDSIVDVCLSTYQKEFPLFDLSLASKKYMEIKKENFYFIYIDTLDKTDVFFPEHEKFLKENTHNILSNRILGKSVDFGTNFQTNAEKYLSQAKHISLSIGSMAKEEISKTVSSGIEKIKEKTPVVQKKFENLKNKLFKLKK